MLTPSAAFYLDPARLPLEYSQVFSRSWQLVGHASQLANPGDYFTTTLGHEPLLLTNDGGTLRGFYNVCRHRAGPVARGCGNARRLACRYHGWTYDLGGQLVATSEMEGAADFDPTTIRLEPIALHRFGPLLFVALDTANTPSFDEFFPGLTVRCSALGLDRLRHVTSRDYHVRANWKVYVDNYLEGYHIPLVHPALNRELDYRQYVTELASRYVLQYAPVRDATSTIYRASAADGQAWYYWLFPNIMLNIYAGQLQTNVVTPLDAQHTQVRFDWYAFDPVPDPNTDERWRELARFSEEIQAEDADICAVIQQNLGSRAYRPGPYSVKREAGLQLFHTLMQAT
jgi:choline monooxygenase